MKQEFETSLVAQDIVVRQDYDETKKISDDDSIEDSAGHWYPLVKINDIVFAMDKIGYMNYIIGCDLIPILDISVKDHDKVFMEEEFPMVDDLVTMRISNNYDTQHKPIKNDFLILDIDSTTEGRSLSIKGLQYIPKLFEYNNKSWDDSLFNICRTIAKECQLGFVTNINDSKDKGKWICKNNYYDYLIYIEKHMDLGDDDCVKIFIDAFNNLNVISLKTAYINRNKTQLLTNPVTGNEYKTNKFVEISNKSYKTKEDDKDEKDCFVKSEFWTPINRYGENYLKTKNISEYNNKKEFNHMSSDFDVSNIQNTKSLDSSKEKIFSYFVDSECSYKNILSARKKNININKILSQGIYVRTLLENYTADIVPFIYIPTKLYNKQRFSKINDQDENKTLEDVSKQEPKYGGKKADVLNKEFTGDYISVECEFKYTSKSKGKSSIKHIITMIKV